MFVLTLFVSAFAAEKKSFDIPAGTADKSLKLFTTQSGAEVVYPAEIVRGVKTPAVKGEMTPDEAINQLLADAPLSVKQGGKSGTFMISRDPNVSRAIAANKSDRPEKTDAQWESAANGEKVLKLDTFEVFGRKTLNMDVVRTRDDPQPYHIMDSTMIERSGASTLEELLKQQLTMNTTFRMTTQQNLGGPTGGSYSSINLRGLGAGETLILIDGRRAPSLNLTFFNSIGALTQPDINGIPLSAIERIEVLPSSASAIYGGAALGGVVNIITKRNFSGGNISANYSRPEDSDAYRYSVNFSYGRTFNSGRTELMLSGSYADGSPLLVGDRKGWVQGSIAKIAGNAPAFIYNPSIIFLGATTNISSGDASNLTLKNGTVLNSRITSLPAGATAGTDLSSGLQAAAGTYNLNLSNGSGNSGLLTAFGTVPLVKSLRGTFRQTLFKDVQFFAEVSASENISRVPYNPFTAPLLVPAGAPTNLFQRNVRVVFPTTFRVTNVANSSALSTAVGLVAPISKAWKAELDFTWSKSTYEFNSGLPDATAVSAAVSSGTINPFVDTIANPPNFSPYLGSQAYYGATTLNDLNLRVGGPVWELPAGLLSLSIGLGHRKEGAKTASVDQHFPITTASDFSRIYFGQPQSTDSVYAETKIPVIAPKNNLRGVNALDIQLAVRAEKYRGVADRLFQTIFPAANAAFDPHWVRHDIKYTSTNPTVAVRYRPTAGITLRTSYSTAFLPPAAGHFLPNPTPQFGFPAITITDPANGLTYRIDLIAGGSPNIKPQTSKTWNAGIIWEAANDSLLHGLRLNIEHYSTEQPNFITAPPAQQVLGDPSLASRVSRDPATGLVTVVDTSYLNAFDFRTAGWDARLDYRRETNAGSFDFGVAATYIDYEKRQYALGSRYLDFAGYPNEGGETKLKANASLGWARRNWTVTWSSTYYSGYRQQNSPGSPSYVQAGGPIASNVLAAQGGNTIPCQIYHNFYARYDFGSKGEASGTVRVGKLLSHLSLEVGVTNVFGTLPPFDAAFLPYYYSPLGDPQLRAYRISLKKSF